MYNYFELIFLNIYVIIAVHKKLPAVARRPNTSNIHSGNK